MESSIQVFIVSIRRAVLSISSSCSASQSFWLVVNNLWPEVRFQLHTSLTPAIRKITSLPPNPATSPTVDGSLWSRISRAMHPASLPRAQSSAANATTSGPSTSSCELWVPERASRPTSTKLATYAQKRPVSVASEGKVRRRPSTRRESTIRCLSSTAPMLTDHEFQPQPDTLGIHIFTAPSPAMA